MFEGADEGGEPQPPVEWLFRDALDAKKDFLEGANIWLEDSALGKLRPECANWVMFKRLADPDHPGQLLQPAEDYDYATYFKDMMGRHQGEVKEVWGHWVTREGPVPRSKSFHHCQYATTDEQRAKMDSFGCRGRKLYNKEKVDWGAAGDLTLDELLAIGSTSTCGGLSTDLARRGFHFCRRAYVVTYNRLLCSLLGQQRIGMYEAEAWWNNARSICSHKVRGPDHHGAMGSPRAPLPPQAPRRAAPGMKKGHDPKGWGKGQPKGKHQHGGKGQKKGHGPKGTGKGQPKGKHQPGGKGQKKGHGPKGTGKGQPKGKHQPGGKGQRGDKGGGRAILGPRCLCWLCL